MTDTRSAISRRRALSGAATIGIGVPLLAACGDDGSDGSAQDVTDATSPSATTKRTTTAEPTDPGTEGSSTAAGGGGIPTSEVPVGGGIIAGETVITQPTEGEFKAFSAVCTHQGCIVASFSDGFVVCPCHGSHFAIDTGQPTSDSLATAPLGSVDITVADGAITIG
ncbi:Rieske (2Fe-2S) protein [Nocardioides humilatus]|uniref:Rieske (2Fe-2S) protein n=1 Tax=Nocardioides humilatus TaxID=2607660 RepID=A0A5B1LA05_9ACTN|nr:Rieske (2Fe-2S) protein [Nocardioides humilatus]KAA1417104.1 Rieske (2Fe-2S) protein [Nocardioides humilatus]